MSLVLEREQKQLQVAQGWIIKPITWATTFLGTAEHPYLPSEQQEEFWYAYGSLIDAKIKRFKGAYMTPEEQERARKIGISIMSGKGTGKDFTSAGAGLHFQACMPEPKQIVTAPAGPQLNTVIWPEFAKLISRSPLLDAIFVHQADKIYLKERGSKAFSIRPRTIQPNIKPEAQAEVLQGVHSLSVQYIIDEASGVPEPVFKPVESGLTDPLSLVIMIFNPTRRTGYAYESHYKARKHWICLHWDGEKTREEKIRSPKKLFWFDEEAQDRILEKYGRDSDYYQISVKGLPGKEASDSLIAYGDVEEAIIRYIESLPDDPICIGVDVAGPGKDKTVVSVFRGPRMTYIEEFSQKNTTEVSDLVTHTLKEQLMQCTDDVQWAIGVDVIGIGRGVVDQLRNVQHLKNVHGIDVSTKSLNEKRYGRLRNEIWWNGREYIGEEQSVSLLRDDDLIAELITPTWKEELGRITVEGKDSLKSRGFRSPNKADSVLLALWMLRKYVSRMPPRLRQSSGLRRRRPFNWKTD